MGALSASGNWIVEDDVLLKNAVEAGASLESLAKGAVSFSRRYSIRELQDRWYSLLYDPEISAQASARIAEYEVELSTSNPGKANKFFNCKKDFPFQKRKIESVRNKYYAVRKRVCNELRNSADFGFVTAACSCIAAGRECICGARLEHSQHDHVVQNIASGVNNLNCYGHPGGSYNGVQHIYAEINGHHSFHAEHVGVVESEVKDGNINNDCLYGYSNGPMYEHDPIRNNPQVSEGNAASLKSSTDFQDGTQFQPLAAGNEVMEASPLMGSVDNGVKLGCFTGNKSVRMQEPGSLQAIDQNECSQAPDVPVWSAIPDIPAPNMLTDMHIKKKGEVLKLGDDKKVNTDNCDDLSVQANLDGEISDSGLENAAISENDFMDFQLIDFPNSEEFELLNGENFLNSPHETSQDVTIDPDTSVIQGSSSTVPNLVHSGKTNMCSHEIDPDHEKHTLADVSVVNLIPATGVSYAGLYVECKLNTEDPDIPCNDDIVIPVPGQPPPQCPSGDQNSKHETCSVSPATAPVSNAGNSNVGDLAPVKEEIVRNVQSSSQPMILNSSTSEQKESVVAFNVGFTAAAKLSEDPSTSGVLVHDRVDAINTKSCPSVSRSVNVPQFGEGAPCGFVQHESFDKSQSLTVEKSINVAEHMSNISLDIPNSYKPEIRAGSALQNCVSSHALSDLELHDPVATVSASDQEEKVSDHELDVPNYFDLEALILDQDLIPCDQGFDSIHPEVSRFQYLESKKTLIRLEQGAQSFMNRAIMSRGAIAILYGQHLKYYIKDPQVSLGRETEDVKVDIDLGKEGRANKISRRQAIIKMDEGGSFHIKNLGKCSIFVNSKEVPSNKRINLTTDSLIEIRDMRFIFHVNQDAVRQRIIRSMRGSSQSWNNRFEWVSSQNP